MPSTNILRSISEEQSVPSQIHRSLCFCTGFSALQWGLSLRQLGKGTQQEFIQIEGRKQTMLFADGMIFYLENAKHCL